MTGTSKIADIRKKTESSSDTSRMLLTSSRFNEKSSRNYGILSKSELQQNLMKSRNELNMKSTQKQQDHLKSTLLTEYRQEPGKNTIRLKESSYNLLDSSNHLKIKGKPAAEPPNHIKPLLNVNTITIDTHTHTHDKAITHRQPASAIDVHVNVTDKHTRAQTSRHVTVVFNNTSARSSARGWQTATKRGESLNRSMIRTQASFMLAKHGGASLDVSRHSSQQNKEKKAAKTSQLGVGATHRPAEQLVRSFGSITNHEYSRSHPTTNKGVSSCALANMRDSQVTYDMNTTNMTGKDRAVHMSWEKYKVSKGLSTFISVDQGVLVDDEYMRSFKHKNIQRWGDFVDLLRSCVTFFKSYNKESFRLSCFEVESLLDKCTFYPGYPTVSQLKSLMSADMIFTIEGVGTKKDIKPTENKSKDKIFSYERSVYIIQRAIRRAYGKRLHLKLESTKRLIGYIGQKMFVKAKYAQTKRLIRSILDGYRQKYTKMCQEFELLWPQTISKKRVEIHLNTLGYAKHLREGMEDFDKHQNAYLRRLSRLKDTRLSMVMVTFDGLPQDQLLYHIKLFDILGLQGITRRFKIVKLVCICVT